MTPTNVTDTWVVIRNVRYGEVYRRINYADQAAAEAARAAWRREGLTANAHPSLSIGGEFTIEPRLSYRKGDLRFEYPWAAPNRPEPLEKWVEGQGWVDYEPNYALDERCATDGSCLRDGPMCHSQISEGDGD